MGDIPLDKCSLDTSLIIIDALQMIRSTAYDITCANGCRECVWQADDCENRTLAENDFVFRRHDSRDPMPPAPSPTGSSCS